MARDRQQSKGERAKGGGQRPLRVGEELRHVLAELLARGDIRDPDLSGTSVTVTEVRVSPDLKNATAFVIPLGGTDGERVVAGLTRCAPWLRGQIARNVRLKYSPRIGFRLDRSFEEASRIDAVLRRPEVAADLMRAEGPEGEAPAGGEEDGA